MSSGTFLASITSVAALWSGLQVHGINSPHTADFAEHPGVFEVPRELRNLYPAENFNRDVTTSWWQTEILDGHSSDTSTEVSDAMRDASYIVLDNAMYSVRLLFSNATHYND